MDPGNKSTYDSTKIFWKNLLNLRVFLGKFTIILTPTILLLIAKFYKEQQAYLQLNEQKNIQRTLRFKTSTKSTFFI